MTFVLEESSKGKWIINLNNLKKKEDMKNCSVLCAQMCGFSYLKYIEYCKDYCEAEVKRDNDIFQIIFPDAISAQILANHLNRISEYVKNHKDD